MNIEQENQFLFFNLSIHSCLIFLVVPFVRRPRAYQYYDQGAIKVWYYYFLLLLVLLLLLC